MPKSSRRSFLFHGAALPAAAAWLPARSPALEERERPATGERAPWLEHASQSTLRALAEVVLPTGELPSGDLDRALERFASWAAGIEPVAELDHPYLSTDQIAYGPPDPRPAWRSQLEALELLAGRRHATEFSKLAPADRLGLLRDQLPQDLPQALPHPTAAGHVAIALLSWFYASDEANDLCYRSRIGRYACRGLPSSTERPKALRGSLYDEAQASETDNERARE